MDERKQKQIIEKNRVLYRTSFLLMGLYILITLTGPGTPLFALRLVVQVLGLIAEIVCSVKLSRKIGGLHACLYVVLVVYLVSFLTNPHQYMYAFMFIVVLMVFFFQDSTLAKRGAVAAISANVVYFILSLTVYHGSLNEAVCNLLVAVVACVVCVNLVKTIEKHNKEDMDYIRAIAEEQMNTADGVVVKSGSIMQQIENADELVESLLTSVDASNDAVSGIADSTKDTAEAIEKQSMMTSDIQENLETVRRRTDEMRDSSDRTAENVISGTKLLKELEEQAVITAEINTETKATTAQLNERITDIEAIIGTILNISSQTNLLALNASIEAARAGEAGKGFAVVADEIRNLSEETKNSTEQITEIIHKFSEDVNAASNSMQRATESSEKQNDMIRTTAENFEQIQVEVSTLSENINSIAAEVDDIVNANTSIMDSITNLSAASEQSAAASESSLSLSEQSLENTHEVKGVLDHILALSKEMAALVEKNSDEE